MTLGKNICYVTASYPFGSGEGFVDPEVNEWVRRGYSLTVVPLRPRGPIRSTCTGQAIRMPLFQMRYLVSVLRWFMRSPRVTLGIFSCILSMPGKILKNAAAIVKAFAVADFLIQCPTSHIHAHWGGTSSTMAMAVSRLTDIPWSLTCHRWDIYENNLLALKSRDARFVRFISVRGRNDAVSLGALPEKCVVIHMGLTLAECRYEAREVANPARLVCAANMIEVKGHRYLIEALKLLRDDGLNATLDLYGDGPERPALVELCQTYKLGEAVTFLGHRPRQDLLDALGSGVYVLFVLPSIELSVSLHEGIPVSIMEAMSCGVPVISTKTGSIEELLPPSLGVTVPDRDASALVAVIRSLLIDNTRYTELSKLGRQIIEEDWQTVSVVDSLEKMMRRP